MSSARSGETEVKAPKTPSSRLTAERPQARRRARHFLAEIKEGAARKNRIVHDPCHVDGRAAPRRRLDAEETLAVARQSERQQAVAERERRVGVGLGAHAWTGQDEDRQRQAQAEGEQGIAEQQADDGRHAGALRGGGAVPGLVPFRPARNVEGNEQGRPGAETPQSLGNGARARLGAQEARRAFIRHVAADEGQVDQRRDAQAHVIEIDQHPQPVIGEQRGEDRQAPVAELRRRQAGVHIGRDAGADQAVLIIPCRIGRDLEEGVDDRRHPQAPAQHDNGVVGQTAARPRR